MRFRDQLSGVFWVGLSVFVCLESYGAGIGGFHAPGPGFLPFLMGIILGTLSLLLIIKRSLRKGSGERLHDPWKGAKWSRVVLVLFSLVLYAIVVTRAGYLLATFGLMVVLLIGVERTRIRGQVILAFVIVLATYAVFHLWLGIQLPKGPLGF